MKHVALKLYSIVKIIATDGRYPYINVSTSHSYPYINVSTSHKDVQLKKIKQGASLTLTKQILFFLEHKHTHKT